MPETPQQPAPPAETPATAPKDAPPPTPPGKEPAGEAEAREPEGGERLTQRFAQLSREKKALARERQEMQAERQRMQAEMSRWQDTYQNARKDPDRWLREGGLTYDQVTDYYKNGGAKNPDPLAEVQTLRQELSQLREQYTAREAAAAQREYMGTIRDALSHDPDGSFELVNLYGVHDEVYEYLDEQCRRTGRMPDKDDIRDAAAAIEEALIEQEESRYKKAQASKKLARRLGREAHRNSPADAPRRPQKHPSRVAAQANAKRSTQRLRRRPRPTTTRFYRLTEFGSRPSASANSAARDKAQGGTRPPCRRLQLGYRIPPTKSRSKSTTPTTSSVTSSCRKVRSLG